jgi:hypothetical protein
MSKVFSQARVVIGWLGLQVRSDQLAFNLFHILGSSTNDSVSGSDPVRSLDEERANAQAIRELTEAGLTEDMEHLFHPSSVVGRAAAALCQRPSFQRLWIVQEAMLAQVLEIRCGALSISSQQSFAGVAALCSTVSDPPMESLHSQYHNSHRLGQLMREVRSREHQSFPYLAHRLSIWDCKKEEDRLNALYGIVFRYDGVAPWFQPSCEKSVSDLYKIFATNPITVTRRLDILHFAGCADSDRLDFRTVDGLIGASVSESRDRTPSWTPDCSVQELRKKAYQIFYHWYALACTIVRTTDIVEKFASTLTMNYRVDGIERNDLKISVHELPTLFNHWAARNFPTVDGITQDDSTVGLEDSTRFGNLAEEICRQWELLHHGSWTSRFGKCWCTARWIGLPDTGTRGSKHC